MLSNTCKYGIRAVIYLAKHAGTGEKIGIKTISGDLGIPTPFLGKILQSLAKQRILSSIKGPNGGFGLGKPAKDICLLDIVLAIDGNDLFDLCLIDVKSCTEMHKDGTPCTIHKKYEPIRKKLHNLFRTITLEQLVQETKKSPNIRL